jgi:hypothetical protein
MGRVRIGSKGFKVESKEPIVEIQKVVEYVDRIQKVEVPVEVIKEVEKIVEKPIEVIKEVEKTVEVRVPYIQFQAPKWAKWAVVVAIAEFVVINLLLAIG